MRKVVTPTSLEIPGQQPQAVYSKRSGLENGVFGFAGAI
jgi:hypothetical protein